MMIFSLFWERLGNRHIFQPGCDRGLPHMYISRKTNPSTHNYFVRFSTLECKSLILWLNLFSITYRSALRLCIAEHRLMNITCDDGWVQYNRSCYKYVPTATEWIGAYRACQEQNSYLADVHSDEELDFLISKILKSIDNFEFSFLFIVLCINIL